MLKLSKTPNQPWNHSTNMFIYFLLTNLHAQLTYLTSRFSDSQINNLGFTSFKLKLKLSTSPSKINQQQSTNLNSQACRSPLQASWTTNFFPNLRNSLHTPGMRKFQKWGREKEEKRKKRSSLTLLSWFPPWFDQEKKGKVRIWECLRESKREEREWEERECFADKRS